MEENDKISKGYPLYFYYAVERRNITPSLLSPGLSAAMIRLAQALNDMDFNAELLTKEPHEIADYLSFHLQCYLRAGGNKMNWIIHTKNKKTYKLTEKQNDAFLTWMENEKLNDEEDNEDNGKKIKLSELKNNFDSIDIEKVYEHFKKGLVDKKYLSEHDLLIFIETAFHKKTKLKKRIALTDVHNKQKVIRVFATYYTSLAGKPRGKQKGYSALLGENFMGYTTKNVSSNFSK